MVALKAAFVALVDFRQNLVSLSEGLSITDWLGCHLELN